jgi:sulfate permease, SulP family
MLGSILIAIALVMGATLTAALSGFPVPILAGLLTVAGLLHITLLKDLRGTWHWVMAIAVGVTGFLTNLAVALVAALVVWWVVDLIRSRRARHE